MVTRANKIYKKNRTLSEFGAAEAAVSKRDDGLGRCVGGGTAGLSLFTFTKHFLALRLDEAHNDCDTVKATKVLHCNSSKL